MAQTEGGTMPHAPTPSSDHHNIPPLRHYVDRLERLEIERRELGQAITEVLKEADGHGYHKRALRDVVRRRLESEKQKAARETVEDMRDAMLARLGMLAGTPLGDAAMGAPTAEASRQQSN